MTREEFLRMARGYLSTPETGEVNIMSDALIGRERRAWAKLAENKKLQDDTISLILGWAALHGFIVERGTVDLPGTALLCFGHVLSHGLDSISGVSTTKHMWAGERALILYAFESLQEIGE